MQESKIALTPYRTYRLQAEMVKKWLPERKTRDNKSHGGRALIWAGSREMPGAALLASRAASRMGAGYVYTSTREVIRDFPEAIFWNQKKFEKIDSVLIGPGLGVHKSVLSKINLLKKFSFPVVIDADALTIAARHQLTPFPRYWIATPHEAELARFIKMSVKDIQGNRPLAARLAQKKLGCTVILKGHRTIVAFEKISVVIPTGNVSLAKGGSGDVLSGMIVGLLAQKVPPPKAALIATYLHGLIADKWIQEKKDYLSLTPSDLVDQIPTVLAELRHL